MRVAHKYGRKCMCKWRWKHSSHDSKNVLIEKRINMVENACVNGELRNKVVLKLGHLVGVNRENLNPTKNCEIKIK